MADPERGHRTVDFSDLPQVVPPKGRAAMYPARQITGDGIPPNMAAHPEDTKGRNVRAGKTHDPRRHGRWR